MSVDSGPSGISMSAIFMLVVLAGQSVAQEELRRTPVVRAVEKAAPAVVNISTQRIVERRSPFADVFGEDIFGRFAGGSVRATGLGSGFLIDPDGFILTNEHVVRQADEILVHVTGIAEPVKAVLVAAEADSDLALLQIRVDHPLPWLPLGTSSDLLIGETTIAIGNSVGLASTVSVGVVSAIDREVVVNGRVVYHDFLQTDASINHGNSGGPLLNILGEVIGINSAIRADAQGIGFAIPIDRVRMRIKELTSPRRLTGGYLGLDIIEVGHGLGTTLEVSRVEAGSAAAQNDIHSGDRILAVAGEPVSSFIQLNKHLLAYRPGDEFEMTLQASQAVARAVRIKVEQVPRSEDERNIFRRLGFVGRAVSETEKSQGVSPGYVVTELRKNSNAEALGLLPGDIFIAFAARRSRLPVENAEQLARILEKIPAGTAIELIIERKGRGMAGTLSVE